MSPSDRLTMQAVEAHPCLNPTVLRLGGETQDDDIPRGPWEIASRIDKSGNVETICYAHANRMLTLRQISAWKGPGTYQTQF